MPPKGSLKRKYVKRASYKARGKKRSYKTIRKRSYKKRYVGRRKSLPGTTGRTKGSYRKMLNFNLTYRRELGMLKVLSPGGTVSISVTAGTPVTQSTFFVANSTNASALNAFLPASIVALPPSGLSEEVYANFYSSMVMYNRIGIKIAKADQNADYGPVRFLLTPIRYVDYITCLTGVPASTGVTWAGTNPASKYANQHDMPHSTSCPMVTGATSSATRTTPSSRVPFGPDTSIPNPVGRHPSIPAALCSIRSNRASPSPSLTASFGASPRTSNAQPQPAPSSSPMMCTIPGRSKHGNQYLLSSSLKTKQNAMQQSLCHHPLLAPKAKANQRKRTMKWNLNSKNSLWTSRPERPLRSALHLPHDPLRRLCC